MDPSGGWFGYIFIGILVVLALLWIFAPFIVAVGATIGLGVLFFGFVFYILSNTKFT